MTDVRLHPTAIIEPGVVIGRGVSTVIAGIAITTISEAHASGGVLTFTGGFTTGRGARDHRAIADQAMTRRIA